MRCFIAINLPPDLRTALADQTAPLRRSAPGERWVDCDHLHATVRFLGDVDTSFIDRLTVALAAAAGRYDPISLEIASIGAFPTWKQARVVWTGVGYDPKLELLHHDVEVACTELGLEVEGRPFRPHVTLARLREPGGAVARAVFRAARGLEVRYAMTLDTIDLMQSTHFAAGSRYTRLAAVPLGRTR